MVRCLRAVSLLAIVAPIVAGCSGAAEHAIIGQFFNASRLRDNTALDSLATVVFDPRTQGTVTTFTIQSIGPERQRGALASKDVTVSAPVRLPDGTTARKTFVITLQRGPMRGDKDVSGRWMVTGYKDASASGATKTSN